jgi:hypothetical protein
VGVNIYFTLSVSSCVFVCRLPMSKQLKSTLGIMLYILGLGLALFVLWYWIVHPSLSQMQLLIELWWAWLIAVPSLIFGYKLYS